MKKLEDKSYHHEIDGLRGIAVIAIIFYHLNLAAFEGAFVTLDMFFVISGFLITMKIIQDFEKERFSFTQFYFRRSKRLFPALFSTVAVTTIAGYFILPADTLTEMAGSVIYAIGFSANFYFWESAGYFDSTTVAKPLLHFWSLSLEEQYYFTFPIVILLALKRGMRFTTWTLVGFGVASLLVCEYIVSFDRDGAYYLLPGRAFEFVIGSLLSIAFLKKRGPLYNGKASPLLQNLTTISGLLCILVVAILFDKSTRFPGGTALLPCIGTALAIAGGYNATSKILLCNRFIRYFGTISYSLYLVHWPIISFDHYLFLEQPTPLRMAIMIGLMILLATASFYLIENRFRHLNRSLPLPNQINRFVLINGGLAFLLLFVVANIWSGRLKNSTDSFKDKLAQTALNPDTDSTQRVPCPLGYPLIQALEDCENSQKDRNIVIIGDSHAHNFYRGLINYHAPRPHGTLAFTGPACYNVKQRHCKVIFDLAEKFLNANSSSIELVIVRFRGMSEVINEPSLYRAMEIYLTQLVAMGFPVLWVGPQMEYFPEVPIILHAARSIEDFQNKIPHHQQRNIWSVDQKFSDFADKLGIRYTSILNESCPDRICPVVFEKGVHKHNLFVYDYGHWTKRGAIYFANKTYRNAIAPILRKARKHQNSLAH